MTTRCLLLCHVPLVLGAWAALAASGCAKRTTLAATSGGSDVLRLKVVRSFPHDPKAFTQGLLFFDGKLYESTGLNGRSSLRQVDPESGVVERLIKLPAELFGEGLARVGDRLFQLTWRNGRLLVWDLATFQRVKEMTYEGEGWGLCFDGQHVVMSDGSDRLSLRDPESFAKVGEIAVRRAGRPVSQLNELECADGVIYANVWRDVHIARIDAATGRVTGWIDASGLLTTAEVQRGVDVLNGIAFRPDTGHLLVGGKLWPRLFEVEIVGAR